MTDSTPIAKFGDVVATDLIAITHNPDDLQAGGWWAVAQTFEGEFTAFRFATIESQTTQRQVGRENHNRIPLDSWSSSMTQQQYEDAVQTIRQDISRGWVYQANLCRVLTSQVPSPIDLEALYDDLLQNNPAPYAGYLRVPEYNIDIASASPELFLARSNTKLSSSPIKGTAKTAAQLLDKDSAENIMIVDLVRNDLSHACREGTVKVDHLLRVEEHPGLVHLVSDISGEVDTSIPWSQILSATSPPGSVSGAPKSSALETIARLETSPRSYYCGAFGWIDTDKDTASLAVAIRTFWQERTDSGASIHFGTGAGITWESDPHGEWVETELKAHRLLNIAAGTIG